MSTNYQNLQMSHDKFANFAQGNKCYGKYYDIHDAILDLS